MRDRIDTEMEILALKGYRSVTELSADLKVSEGTIRRYLDLEELNIRVLIATPTSGGRD